MKDGAQHFKFSKVISSAVILYIYFDQLWSYKYKQSCYIFCCVPFSLGFTQRQWRLKDQGIKDTHIFVDQEPARRLQFLHKNEQQHSEGGGWEPLPLQDTEHRIDCWWQKVPIPFSSITIEELGCHHHPSIPCWTLALKKSAPFVSSASQRHFHCYGYRNLHKISQHICCSIYHASMVDWYLTKVFPRISTFWGKVKRHAIKVFLGIVIPPICFPIASKTESSF